MSIRAAIATIYLLLLAQGAKPVLITKYQSGLLIHWAGYEWQVKIKELLAGPGPNYFGLHAENVLITKSNALQLTVAPVSDSWSCAELFTTQLLRNGLYLFEIEGSVRYLYPQLVAGMFTYNEARDHHYNESDVEISQWGDVSNLNAQFAHYAVNEEPEVHRFALSETSRVHTFILHKTRGEVAFYYLDRKFSPKIPPIQQVRAFQRFSNITHQPDYFRVHINLWLFRGQAPLLRTAADRFSFTINRFEYLPE
ncbi:hypothetical protein JCM31826_11720 [Thermaurantimonas aggregans]|uniref:Uncharacterized protein n=1 Tax=Thermaurantimonas aggregans TaxID=2173829 RepID=A0A401XL27_9FLAO|nr:hypothetical protein [Thermaurantimonas aggregans]MCX8148264.1 hypothetical protein [Thermaurantimonas aggregans]GCD77690.1 hypothetical protein JCM31826_11720 [Thermaurantimonas aggregans]